MIRWTPSYVVALREELPRVNLDHAERYGVLNEANAYVAARNSVATAIDDPDQLPEMIERARAAKARLLDAYEGANA